MIKKKNLLVIATAGVVALGYAAISTNAFADTSVVVPIPAVSTPATPTAAITPPAVPLISTDVSATAGIQAPSGLANSPLSTMPTAGDDDADDQSGDLSADVSLSGDGEGDDSSSVGVSVSESDDNGGDSQQNNGGQDGSGSND